MSIPSGVLSSKANDLHWCTSYFGIRFQHFLIGTELPGKASSDQWELSELLLPYPPTGIPRGVINKFLHRAQRMREHSLVCFLLRLFIFLTLTVLVLRFSLLNLQVCLYYGHVYRFDYADYVVIRWRMHSLNMVYKVCWLMDRRQLKRHFLLSWASHTLALMIRFQLKTDHIAAERPGIWWQCSVAVLCWFAGITGKLC